MPTLWNNLETFRKRAQISRGELADKMDVPLRAITNIEYGNMVPSVLLALKLAKFFKVNVEDIFNYST